MLTDTHAHLNFAAYKDDADEVIRRSLGAAYAKAGSDPAFALTGVINVGTNYQTSNKAVEIAQRYEEGVYAAVGLHPVHLETGLVKIRKDPEEFGEDFKFEKDFDYEKYKTLAQSDKVVAIGEIGLDYYCRPKTQRKKALFKEKQKELFLKQLTLAKDLNLPVILHCRMAHQNLLEILQSRIKSQESRIKGVVHSFLGTLEQLQAYLDLGFYIGFNGIIFKTIYPVRNQKSSNRVEGINFEEIIKKTPLKRILIETDCPYLTPPQQGDKRNEPLFVKYVAERIAEVKGITFKEVAEITTQNAKQLFF